MELPKWNQLFLPALKAYGDEKPHINRDVKVNVADSLGLSENLRNIKTALHGENKIEGRVGWAISALKIAGLLENYSRGSNIITQKGKEILSSPPTKFNEQFLLDNFPTYRTNKEGNINRYREKQANGKFSGSASLTSDYTPEETIDKSVDTLNLQLSNDLLAKLRTIDPYLFEEVVANLLEAMGYGELTVTKKSSDGGIDAVVNEDKLGLDKILVQAKRYADGNIVNELDVRNFAGALATRNVRKGIFVTTSSFSQTATSAVSSMQIKLIDGEKLTQLMIENNIGVSVEKLYHIRRIDSDYFDN